MDVFTKEQENKIILNAFETFLRSLRALADRSSTPFAMPRREMEPVLIGEHLNEDDYAMFNFKYSSVDAAKEAYANYAHPNGFAMTTKLQKKDKNDKTVVQYATYRCNKHGYRKISPSNPRNQQRGVMIASASASTTKQRHVPFLGSATTVTK